MNKGSQWLFKIQTAHETKNNNFKWASLDVVLLD